MTNLHTAVLVLLTVAASLCVAPAGSSADDFADRRQQMVAWQISGRGISDPSVLKAMSTVPRHRFVPDALEHLAYRDSPLPIGHGQTISQPYIVALMSQLLAEGGRMVIPSGEKNDQQLFLLTKHKGKIRQEKIVDARFVPMVDGQGKTY